MLYCIYELNYEYTICSKLAVQPFKRIKPGAQERYNELMRNVLLGRHGLMFYYRWFFYLFISFATHSSRSLGRSPWNFATWSETGCALCTSPKIGPKTSWPKSCKISVDFLSKIGKTCDRVSRAIPSAFYEKKVRWTLVHKLQRIRPTCEFGPTQMDFSGDYMSAIRGFCPF